MNKKNLRITIAIIVVAILIAALFLLPKGPVDADSGQHLVMGTFSRIISVAANSNTAEKAIEAGLAQLRKAEELMSSYKEDSEITEINRSAHKSPVKVSNTTFEVLQTSLEFSKLTEGAFDITVGPLEELWRSAAEANSPPTEADLQQARSKVGYEKLILDANEMTVRFLVDGMKIDLGGIAKGYAIDKAVEAMQKCGAAGGMVDVGGDIRCFGTPPKGKKFWLIGLQEPDVTNEILLGSDEPVLVLKLKDAAVATSGDYQRFILVGGERYSHIIDRRTAAAAKGLSSVTIIGKNATRSDALATAVSVMGAEKGVELIEKLPEIEAILITTQPQRKLIKTNGAEKYIK